MAGCQLTNADSTVQLSPADTTAATITAADTTTTAATHGNVVVCMSAGALVQCGHTVSFHLHHTDTNDAHDAGRRLMLSEHDGVGLSVTDDVNVDSDNVIFYSFHGNNTLFTIIQITHRVIFQFVGPVSTAKV